MVPRCPECLADLELEESRDEHMSAAGARWWCVECEIGWLQDGSGLLVEVE